MMNLNRLVNVIFLVFISCFFIWNTFGKGTKEYLSPTHLSALRAVTERGIPNLKMQNKELSSHYIIKIMSAFGEALAENIRKKGDRIILYPNNMLLAGCIIGDIDLVFESLSRGAYTDLAYFDVTPLMLASFFGHIFLVELLMYPWSTITNILMEMPHIEVPRDPHVLGKKHPWGDINAVDRFGNSALMYAVVGGNYDTSLLLLENGSDILHHNHFGANVEAMAHGSKNKSLKYMIHRKAEEYRNSLVYKVKQAFGF